MINELRHSVAVSNLPSAFGKFGHILLSRNVVSQSQIWTSIDPFTRMILEKPNRLDWLVGSLDARNSVTIHAGFSCLDSGESTAFPLTWWASQALAPLTNKSNGPGGAVVEFKLGDAAVNDITDQCFQARRDSEDLRIVEHPGQHDGKGDIFKIDYEDFVSIVDDNTIFDEFGEQRANINPSNAVIYEKKSKIPLIIGITFVTGFRLRVPQSVSTQKTFIYRVPMTPLASITKHSGAFLQETATSTSVPRTTTEILVLNVISNGLALLVGVWLICKYVSDTKRERNEANLERGPQLAVEGTGGWIIQERATLMVYVLGVIILAAPSALAIVEGKIDPRASLEVTTGATVLYGSSNANLTGDSNNPVAGAPFQVTVWMSVRKLDEGHVVALVFSLIAIFVIAVYIVFKSMKPGSEVMPSKGGPVGSWSILKRIGTFKLWWMAKEIEPVRRYKLFVEFSENAIVDEGPLMSEDLAKELLLLGDIDFRERTNTYYRRQEVRTSNESLMRSAREAVYNQFIRLGQHKYGILARVRMDNRRRYEAIMSRSSPWHDRLPREWEWLRRLCGCNCIEWHRTRGSEFPPDKALALVRIGLLKYMSYVKKVTFLEDTSQSVAEYDEDGVKCVICVTGRNAGFDGAVGAEGNSAGESTVNLEEVDAGLLGAAYSQQLGSEWRRGQFYVPFSEGNNIRVSYYRQHTEDAED